MTDDAREPAVDQDFRALPLTAAADAALQYARELGVQYADVRVQRNRRSLIGLHDNHLAVASDDLDLSLGARVLVAGVWGFATTDDLSPESATRAVRDAVELALVSTPLARGRIALAPAATQADRVWTSAWRIDPFLVSRTDQIGLLEAWSAKLLGHRQVTHVDASLVMLKEQKFYASSEGSTTLQQRIMLHPEFTVLAVDREDWQAEVMRTLAPPCARGWEYLSDESGWDWAAELAALPELVAERLYAPSIIEGAYDLVIDPTNLWRTLHETVGHSTEIDRALGHEATLSGDTFASPLRLGDLAVGSELMNVTGDRTTPHGCATIGYDDDGVPATSWNIIEQGVLTSFQVDRANAAAAGEERSNGCSYAPSAGSPPMPRCANVSLTPHPQGPHTDELIAAVERGLFIVGDAGFGIDRHCLRFRAGAQRAYQIVGGEVRGQVRDVAYQSSTPEFWTALIAIGGPRTNVLGGTSNCSKGEPRDVAWASHGCPSALFADIPVVNTHTGAGG